MTMTSAASSATTGVLPVDIEAFVSAADDWPYESLAVQAERRRIAHRGQVVKAYCVAADAAALVAAALVALGAGVVLPTNPPGVSAIAIAIGSVPARLLIFAYYGLYKTRYVAHHIEEFRRLVAATAFGALLLAVIEYATRTVLPRGYLLAVLVMSGVLVAIEREIVRALFRRARRNGRQLRPLLLVGAGRDAQVAARAIPSNVGNARNSGSSMRRCAPANRLRTRPGRPDVRAHSSTKSTTRVDGYVYGIQRTRAPSPSASPDGPDAWERWRSPLCGRDNDKRSYQSARFSWVLRRRLSVKTTPTANSKANGASPTARTIRLKNQTRATRSDLSSNLPQPGICARWK